MHLKEKERLTAISRQRSKFGYTKERVRNFYTIKIAEKGGASIEMFFKMKYVRNIQMEGWKG